MSNGVIINIINGDLLETDAKYICHQVNCAGKMGRGVAKQIASTYPEVYSAYIGKVRCANGIPDLIGDVQFVNCKDGKTVINMFSQGLYGGDGQKYTNYTAFANCLYKISNTIQPGETIAMPYKIGCGLGGGSWGVIQSLIEKILCEKHTVKFYRKE